MALRQIIPAPYTFDVYPIVTLPKNALGNKTRQVSETAVSRSVQSISVMQSDEVINPAFIDRVVTDIYMMVPDPRSWQEGDEVVIPRMGRYQVDRDPAPRDMGPITQLNHLFGGRVTAKRVN